MQKYDYIITGTGASGLMLIYQMLTDSFFDQKQILLIDKDIKNQNDRTWCFWEEEKGIWDHIVSKNWNRIFFGSQDFSDTIDISPYRYKLIRSKDFYDFIFVFLQEKSNVTLVQEKVIGLVDEGGIVEVETDQKKYLGDKVFNSVLLSSSYETQQKYPLLNQHFIGWFIKTETPVFDRETATFMDFTVDQNDNTRFMYFLPISETEALFEYTLFSKNLLSKSAYETEIKAYLESKGIKEYQITEKEKGCIPMTCYEFRKQNSTNIIHIGTAGGWTKPSTGFTFHNSEKRVRKLVAFLKKNNDLSRFEKRTKFWYYDLLLLDFLSKENQNGAALFSRLFRRNKTSKILKFLDEETSFLEDIKIMSTMPIVKFLKIIWNRLLK
ncbi:lycopene cyclase family protein [uncultured Aquimarina sp.]|uniref:lycopene cyclase family protein n=1 Tax=uncultured Aquimarina sp. TaxID=575652 RepID=UPI0026365D64|nr:lycopene cyclase family protein [uncultured Aquimarina sp.]